MEEGVRSVKFQAIMKYLVLVVLLINGSNIQFMEEK